MCGVEILAAGDVVNIDMGALTSYQPAAGVEIFVLKAFRDVASLQYIGFQNGVTTSSTYSIVQGATEQWSRFAITNTEYYYQSTVVVNTGFSGIQIK